jgi:hypothetical protein
MRKLVLVFLGRIESFVVTVILEVLENHSVTAENRMELSWVVIQGTEV